ncbi:prion-like protein doppel [Thomomys bottae]
MRKHLGVWCLAIACVLLFSQLSLAKARGVKHRFKWNRKPLPNSVHITEARVAENRPGTFIKQGRKLDIDFGAEGNRYYEANYWQFPDGIHYEGCSDANVTREVFVARCVNATQAANQAEFAREKQDKLYQRVLWRLIKELCSLKHCDFWSERGQGGQGMAVNQPATLGLMLCVWFILT